MSKAYKESMKQVWRNIGYIKVYIGVINKEAQKRASAEDGRNSFTYFSDPSKPFDAYAVDHVYATAEEDFSAVDGSMYFLPEAENADFFNQGIVTRDFFGTVYVVFNFQGLDIKGLTIDFGECYPVDFTVENDRGVRTYTGNDKRKWVTEDVFEDTSFLKITPQRMVNGTGRLRIWQFICGIANVFTDDQVQAFTYKDKVSPISEKLPSQDMSITVDNLNRYYDADNPQSTLGFMETGQEIQAYFGYDVEDDGRIEWLEPFTCYLKKWSADNIKAKFTATDRFDNMTGKYQKGLYREEGISLYDLAEDVLMDAQVDQREYFIDPYLKKVSVKNPLPIVKHTEALQMIANAGRCILTQDRKKKICIRSAFLPDMEARAERQTPFSRVENILKKEPLEAYGMASRDFSVADGTIRFLPENGEYLSVGYVSEAVADENGHFQETPRIEIVLEAGYSCYGLELGFRAVAPTRFIIETFYGGIPVDSYEVENASVTEVLDEEFLTFDKMVLTFLDGIAGSRVTLDRVVFGNVTDYVLDSRELIGNSPMGTREARLKSLSVKKWFYEKTQGAEAADLISGNIVLETEGQELELTVSKPAYGYSVAVEAEGIRCEILEAYSYYVKLKFFGIKERVSVKYILKGYSFSIYESSYTVQHDTAGAEREWKNQLISDDGQAADLEAWLADYYQNNLTYDFKYRGDPRVDANDLFFLQRGGEESQTLICAHEIQLNYKGSWDGKMKARRTQR